MDSVLWWHGRRPSRTTGLPTCTPGRQPSVTAELHLRNTAMRCDGEYSSAAQRLMTDDTDSMFLEITPGELKFSPGYHPVKTVVYQDTSRNVSE